MKRSEMIELMHKNISSVLCTLTEFDKNDCDRLLKEMEEMGMLPPKRVLTREEYKHLSDIEWSEYCYGEKLAKWEKE